MPCVRWNCLLILFKDSKIATVKSTIVIYLILHNVLLVNHKIYYLYIVKYIYFLYLFYDSPIPVGNSNRLIMVKGS